MRLVPANIEALNIPLRSVIKFRKNVQTFCEVIQINLRADLNYRYKVMRAVDKQ
jgi:hypothetical protein